MRNNNHGGRRPGYVFRLSKPAVFLAISAFALALSAQTNAPTKVKNFSVPEYCDPPKETQMKSLLQGAEAEPIADGRILITGAKLQTFNVNGQPEMLVQSPLCVFDSMRREVASDGPIHVQSSDGKMDLDGRGFLWQQTNSFLMISNRVRTIIRNTPDKSRNR